jgi:class 3 adenylate cyclase/YHS domain-containing protein
MPKRRTAERHAAQERDLALMIADLSGYTALTEAHGALEASEIVRRFLALVSGCLEPSVFLVNSVGDEVFCAGADGLAVVRTALRLRDGVEREKGFPRIRTGLHRGPVIVRGGRYFGAPINLTARLAGRALGGQILCTQPVAETARTLADFDPRPLGEARFKNVTLPVAVFELARVAERRVAAALDPVCRMQIDVSRAAATLAHGGRAYHFCSLECRSAFEKAPELYLHGGGA